MATQTAIRDLQLNQGDPGATLSFNRETANGVADAVPDYNKFNSALMGLLQKYQQMGTKPFVEQQLNAEDAKAGRIAAPTPENLIGASPAQQEAARSASAQALNPTIQGAQDSTQTFTEQLKSGTDQVKSVQSFIKDLESQHDKERDDARAILNQAITNFGANAFDIVDRKLIKLAGYSEESKTIAKQTLKEKELQMKAEAAALKVATAATAKPKLGTAAQADVATMGTLEALSNQLLAKYQQGGLEGIGGFYKGSADQFLRKNLGQGSDSAQQNRDLIGNIKATIALLRGGTSFTANEQALLESYTPTINENPASVAQKLKDLNAFIKIKRNQTYQAAGGGSALIRVKEKASGKTGSIPEEEFDSGLYEKL